MSSDQEEIVPEEELLDDTPAFLNPDDAVEVQVGDDAEPMEEEDDDDNDNNDSEEAAATMNQQQQQQQAVTDTSRVQLKSHAGPVYSVATSLDADHHKLTVLSGGGDDQGFLHQIDVTNPSISTSLPLSHTHTDSVSCTAFNAPFVSDDLSKTPKLAAVGAYDGAILLYDPDTGAYISSLEGPTDVEWLAFHPKGGTVLLAGSAADGTVWMYHIPLKKCMQVFVGHESAVTAGGFSPDGRWALSCSADGTLRIWAPKTGMNKHTFRFGTSGATSAATTAAAAAGLTSMGLAGGSDGQLVIVGSEDGQAHVCHIGTKKVVASLRHYEVPAELNVGADEEAELPSSVEAVAFAPVNPNWCATGGVDGVLKVWDLANHAQCRQVCRPGDDTNVGITRLQWHTTLPLLFVCYTNGALRVWDARNGQLLSTYTGSSEVINDLSVEFLDAEGKTVIAAAASDDGTIRLFDINVANLLEQSVAN